MVTTRAKRWVSNAAIGATLGALGCSAETGGPAQPLDATEEPLSFPATFPNPWSVLPNDANVVNRFVDAGICRGHQGSVIIGRDLSTNRYRTLVSWRLFSENPVWRDTSPTTYTSKPACTDLDELVDWWDPQPPLNYQIFVVGRNAQNLYYARTMLLDTVLEGPYPTLDPPEHPTPVVSGHTITTDAYASAPATTVAWGTLMVVGRRSDNRLWLHRNQMNTFNPQSPYSSANWQAAIQLPPLPDGWTAAGDPTIANSNPLIGVVTIMTRASKLRNRDRLYYIYWNGSSFVSWYQYPTGGTLIYSDPSLEVDAGQGHDNVATVWMRGASDFLGRPVYANEIYQSSTDFLGGFENFSRARPDEGLTFTGSPAAAGRLDSEGMHHTIALRNDGSSQLYLLAPNPSRAGGL